MLPNKLLLENQKVEEAINWLLETFSSSEKSHSYIDSLSRSNQSEIRVRESIAKPFKQIKSWFTSDTYKKWNSSSERTELDYTINVLWATLFFFKEWIENNDTEFISSPRLLSIVNNILENFVQLFQKLESIDANEVGKQNEVIVGMKIIIKNLSDKETISRVKTLCSTLVRLSLIDKKSKDSYFEFFRGAYMKSKVEWKSHRYVLRYVMISLKAKNLFINFDKTKIWPRVAECFTINGVLIRNAAEIRNSNKAIVNTELKNKLDAMIDSLVSL